MDGFEFKNGTCIGMGRILHKPLTYFGVTFLWPRHLSSSSPPCWRSLSSEPVLAGSLFSVCSPLVLEENIQRWIAQVGFMDRITDLSSSNQQRQSADGSIDPHQWHSLIFRSFTTGQWHWREEAQPVYWVLIQLLSDVWFLMFLCMHQISYLPSHFPALK